MPTSPAITGVRPFVVTLAGPPAGTVTIQGTGQSGYTGRLTDTFAGAAVILDTFTIFGGSWGVAPGAFGMPALAAGLHSLVFSQTGDGTTTASAPVTVVVGTDGGDVLAGQAFTATPQYIFGGNGDDTIQAYAPGTPSTASPGRVTINGGTDRSGAPVNSGIDSVLLPLALAAVGHNYARSPGNLVLTTPAATVAVTEVEKLVFTDATLTVRQDVMNDFLYYDQRYPDLAAADVDPHAHYATSGWHEGRDPNPLFSTNGYLSAYADVRQAGINPLDHYVANGGRELRDPSAAFDSALYLKLNPDVAQRAFALVPLQHYLTFGIAEGRRYLPAIDSANVRDGFDPLYYKLANPDVGFAGVDPLTHFLQHGAAEGRNPDAFFDVAYYLGRNPDVAASGINPLTHYYQYGWLEGRDPSAQFGTSAYLAANPDVARAGVNPLQHFLANGAAEGRLP